MTGAAGGDPTLAAAALDAYAARLGDLAGLAVAEEVFTQLQGALHRATADLGELGPAGACPAAVLTRRQEYLADAALLLRQELTRLAVARAAPAESDLNVQVTRTRDAVAYLAEITADLLPARMCRTLAVDLAMHPSTAVIRALRGLRAVCDLAEAVAGRATAAIDPPTGAAPERLIHSLLRDRRAEIDTLIAALSS